MDLGLRGKVFIVTGGTRGIGAAIVDQLIDEGASVAFCARNAEQVAARVDSLSDKGRVIGEVVDVSDAAALQAFLSRVSVEFGRIDGYVANVSGGAKAGEEGWEANFNIDIMASVRGAELLLPALAQTGGSILMLASIAAVEAMGNAIAYGPAKAAVIAYASMLGDMAGRSGVRVNSVSPGPIHVDDGHWGQVQRDNPQIYDAVAGQCPLGRLGKPEEVARAAAFLLSPAASYINRANLIIDGGFSRKIQF